MATKKKVKAKDKTKKVVKKKTSKVRIIDVGNMSAEEVTAAIQDVLPPLTDAEMNDAMMINFDDPTDDCTWLSIYDHIRWENPHGILLCVDDGTNEVNMSLDYDRIRHLHGVLGSWIATTMGDYHD